MVNLKEISRSIVEGDTGKAPELTKAALASGMAPRQILEHGLIAGIKEVGDMYTAGRYYLPELLVSGEAMKAALEILKPALSYSNIPPVGKFLIGTVQGDIHDIGKNIVIMMLEGNGWEVTDLGIDVTPQQFCDAVKEGRYDIVGLSALLTSTMVYQAETVKALSAMGLRNRIRVMIGGAPVSQAFANQIGADGYAVNAIEAVKKAAILISRGKAV